MAEAPFCICAQRRYLAIDLFTHFCSLISIHLFPFTFLVRLKRISDLYLRCTSLFLNIKFNMADHWGDRCMVVAKRDAREVGDLELFQICQSTSLPGMSVNFFR